jgi:hypothetical protein
MPAAEPHLPARAGRVLCGPASSTVLEANAAVETLAGNGGKLRVALASVGDTGGS